MTKTEALWDPDILKVSPDAPARQEKKTITLKRKTGPVVVDVWPARQPSGATPILLIHGWGGSGSYWEDTARRLSQTVQVVVPDLPGTGRSLPVNPPQNMFDQVNTLKLIVETLKLEKVQIIGHSMGAAMTLLLNEQIPDRVERLVLTSMCFFMTEKQAEIYTGIMKVVRLMMRIRFKQMAEIPGLSYMMALRYFYRVPNDPAALRQGFLDYLTLDFETAAACAKNVTDPRIEASGAKVQVPTLLIACRQDQVMPVENVNYSVGVIPNCQLRWMEECGHLPMVEKADEYMGILHDFLHV
ncbi:MAG: alpha/beta hydrolase [Candidatus Promineifilaceae bacterium]|nr:alpha/beta hydrolase [Anaerolineaceae bacterium]